MVIASMLVGLLPPQPAQAAVSGTDFKADRIMDDPIFFDNTRMGSFDIQAFLNSKVPVCDTWGEKPYGGTTRRAYSESQGNNPPFTCLKDYRQDIPSLAANQFCQALSGGNKSAAEIIKIVSDACWINPQILLILLQKEQALVTDDWPWQIQYRSATGYGCPDTAPCDEAYYGFFNQVYNAAKQYQRYAKYPDQFSYRAGRNNFIQYNPNAGCGGTQIGIQNQTTAGLYNYTPYQPNQAALNNLYGTGDGCSAYGNRNFWRMYNDWFGPPVLDFCRYGDPSSVIADIGFRKIQPNVDTGVLTLYSGTQTNCIEAHTWRQGFTSWQQNTASNHPIINPIDGAVRYADLTGDGKDEPVLIAHHNTGSGMIEFHVWDTSMRTWIVHAVSNLEDDPQNISIDFADLNGDGKDEPIAIGYAGTTSGNVELHTWNDGVKTWRNHIVTNLPAINPANMNIGFADLDGNGTDEAIAIGVNNTATSNIEIHIWEAGQWSWKAHYVTNYPVLTNGNTSVTFADIDGDKRDEGILVGRNQTGSGRYEFHVWHPSFNDWRGHFASNQPTL